MIKHKQRGFTVVELVIVIIIIAVLATVTTIAYRSTQANARNEKMRTDALMLQAAVEEYYADNGEYPSVYCPTGPGGTNECHNNEAWQFLLSQGYIMKAPSSPSTTNYTWLRTSATAYAIRVPLESPQQTCKIGKNMQTSWWGDPECNF